MSSCASVPTETQFGTQFVTTNSLSTTFSTSVTTLPPTTVTSTSIVCLDSNATEATCRSTSTSLIVITSPGGTSTVSVPVTVTVPVTLTSSAATRTLFSTSCSSITTPTSPTTSPTTASSTSSSSSSSSSNIPNTSATPPPSSTLSLSTPPPTTFTSASALTLSNGTVVTTNLVLTTTLPASPVYVTTPAPSYNGDGNGKTSAKAGPIAGGVIGGVLLLAIIGGIWFLWRRSKRWNDIFDKEEEEKEEHRPRMSLDGEDVEPRPYHYGLVGHSASPSPPSSPPLRTSIPAHSPSNSLSLLNVPANHHSRSGSQSQSDNGYGPNQSSPSRDLMALSHPDSLSRTQSDLSNAPNLPPSARLYALSSSSRSQSDVGYGPNSPHPSGHMRPNLSSTSSAASTRPLLERSINNQSRPPSSWSVGGQSADVAPVSGSHSFARPHSAGGTLQCPTAAAFPGSTAQPDNMPPPRSSPVSEKRRLLASLPSGAAAPAVPSSSPALIPGPGSPPIQLPRGDAPPLTPRNPTRPTSSRGDKDAVLVHVDGGPASSSQSRQQHDQDNGPPAYSPT